MPKKVTDADNILEALDTLVKAGCTLVRVYDGEGYEQTSDSQEALKVITNLDDAYMFVQSPGRERQSWVRFVLGNDPEEVVCDYTVDLEPVLGPLTESWWM